MNLLERATGAARHEALFSDDALLRAMTRFEAALAQAQAETGLIPQDAAAAITRAVSSFAVDARELAARGAQAGSLAIPFVQALRAHVSSADAAAGSLLHHGSTSQDVLDTAMALCTREAVDALDHATRAALAASRALALAQRDTPMLARTLLQPAGVTSVGLKAAQWHAALAQCRQRIARGARAALAVSLAGATGNLATLGPQGAAVRAALARRLDLRDPEASWHSLRHNWIALSCDTALLCGTLAKIAQDIALLTQAEVGEMEEGIAPGRGGSSALPHKRNPVLCLQVLTLTQPIPGWIANLLAALPQPHERALGAWQAELAQIPAVFCNACAAAQALAELLEGLVVRGDRCLRNIDALHGVIFAEAVAALWADALGKPAAQALLTDLSRQALDTATPLRELALSARDTDARLSTVERAALEACFDVARAARAAGEQVAVLLGAASPWDTGVPAAASGHTMPPLNRPY